MVYFYVPHPNLPIEFWPLVGGAHSTEPLILRPIDPRPSVRWIFKINGPYHLMHNLSWECMHPISYMFDVCMYVWMHGNDACQVDRKKGDVRGQEAKCVTQIAMSGPKREGWLPFPAKGTDVVPHQPFISRQRTRFCRSGFELQPATRTAVETSVSRSWVHACQIFRGK